MNKKEHIGRNILITVFVILILCFDFGVGFLLGGATNFIRPSGRSNTDLSTMETVMGILENDFYFGKDTSEYRTKLIDDAIEGMVNAQNDPYTEYMSAEELAEFTSSLESNFVGIGVSYTSLENGLLVVRVIEFSPAEAAGVQAGDIIVAVDGRKISEFGEEDIVNSIRGIEGTDVVITVLRGTESLDIRITRAKISSTVSSEMKGNTGIMVITSFSDGTGTEVKNHLQKLKDLGAENLIIDLRDNGGGYVTTLDEISSCFMNNGDVIMREYDRDGNEIIDKVRKISKFEFEKIILLVNGYSASCSEVFAQAMRENCNAVLVGETTYGKGVAQITKFLNNGGAIKYTDVIWKSGNGVFIGEGTGIKPDYDVRLHEALYLPYLNLEKGQVIKYDSVDASAGNIQQMLDFLGYKVNRFDGYYDYSTYQAVIQFQTDNGLTASGNVDQATADLLNSSVVREWNNQREKHDVQMAQALQIAGQ